MTPDTPNREHRCQLCQRIFFCAECATVMLDYVRRHEWNVHGPIYSLRHYPEGRGERVIKWLCPDCETKAAHPKARRIPQPNERRTKGLIK